MSYLTPKMWVRQGPPPGLVTLWSADRCSPQHEGQPNAEVVSRTGFQFDGLGNVDPGTPLLGGDVVADVIGEFISF